MNPVNHINTIDLLNTKTDAVYIMYHNVFRLLKPVRRKYNLSCNALLILNAIYVYHKYKGSLFTINSIQQFIRYYDKNRVKWYVTEYLLKKGFIILSETIKNINYYKITDVGIQVMVDFGESYQEVLSKWYIDNKIEL